MDHAAPTPLSGRQLHLTHGEYSAVVASVGASLRELRFGGRDLIRSYDADEIRPNYRGAILAPWPNRVVDGTYTLDGATHRLSLTEPERSHALHGLLAWEDWETADQSDSSVRLRATVVPQEGYPFRLTLETTYTLDDGGLTTTVTATNTGPDAAPYGVAPHPYLVAGDGLVDEWTLAIPADTVLEVTEDRLIPTALAAVSGDFDFRTPRRINDTFLDHAFTGVQYDDGAATVSVTGPDGHGAAVSFGSGCPWVQVHTGDLPKDPAGSRRGLAVEPMTCPPDAFNSGTDLVTLQPGADHTVSWRIHSI
ncbi:aldose 1-epimerase family protein [Arthrobacter sp. TB 23]|uniref:aldose 1-epimerase family protein n=1 Tax=Arthrobacter sp. TB 23 TaxID=494419 RepID=UPI0002E11A2A|nr:aldose 1-epimerase family protein [Arthrobacter sp. TB 23]